MANRIAPKRSDVASAVPATGGLVEGELATNSADKTIYQRVGLAVVAIANYFDAANVRSTLLTGLSIGAPGTIEASDSVLGAFGKIQATFNYIESEVASTVSDIYDAIALKGNIDAQTWTGNHTFSGNATFRGSQAVMISQDSAAGFSAQNFGSSASQFVLLSAAGTEASPSSTVSGTIGALSFRGYAGSGFTGSKAFIQAVASENWTSTANGTELRFQTTPAGSTAMGLRLTISGDGHILPGTDNTQNIGSASKRAKEIFAGNATINTSDAREKTPPRHLTPDELAAALDIARLPCVFQWLAAIEEKGGEGARLHVSPTVQDVIAAMESHGLDPFRYGFVCYDEWDEQPEVTETEPAQYDDEGNVIREEQTVVVQEYRPAGNRYSLRPSELAHFIQAAVVQRQDAIEARLAALEAR